MAFQGELEVFNDSHGFSLAIMGVQWRSWVFNGDYGFSMAIMGF